MTGITRVLNFLLLAFEREPRDFPTMRQEEEARREDDISVVRKFSSGNIRLQQGDFDTKEDLEREYERITKIRFSE